VAPFTKWEQKNIHLPARFCNTRSNYTKNQTRSCARRRQRGLLSSWRRTRRASATTAAGTCLLPPLQRVVSSRRT